MAPLLIVDDRPEIQTLLGAVVQRFGFESTVAASAEEARAQLTQSPEMIFVDLGLPGLSGADFVRELRGMQEFAQTPIVIVSANAIGAEQLADEQSGPVEVVTKPFRFERLAKIIEKYFPDRRG